MADLILDTQAIDAKIKRLAYEIFEHNYQEKELYLLGLNTKGNILADLIFDELKKICSIDCRRAKVIMNPAKPLEEIQIDTEPSELKNKVLILIDDVANTGRSLFYACRPLMEVLPKKIEFAVLVDRKHKQFPVRVDYVGLALATTLKEHILVKFGKNKKEAFFN